MKGKFYVFEGIDGSGKSTQARKLLDFLEHNNIRASLHREPGGTPVGERIRDILLSKKEFTGGMSPVCEYLLFAASRSELSRQIILPRLEAGETVILDRFGFSSVAYQGYGRGVDIDFIHNVNAFVTSEVVPDRVFLMDINPDTALQRMRGAGDRIEKEGIDFFLRIRNGYLAEAEKNSVFKVIDSSKAVDQTFNLILESIRKDFNLD